MRGRSKLITNNDYTSCLYQFSSKCCWCEMLFWLSDVFFRLCYFQNTLFSLDDVYIERWLVSWSWWHQTRYCPMCEAKHGSIAPPTTPHPQLCRDTNSQCSASILHQPQYQMQCKPVLFNFWYSSTKQMWRMKWMQLFQIHSSTVAAFACYVMGQCWAWIRHKLR